MGPINMGVSEEVLTKVGAAPEVDGMSKDDLANLCKQLYDRACGVFGEKFDEEYQMKKRDMEIHNLEMETSESHGTFKIRARSGQFDHLSSHGAAVVSGASVGPLTAPQSTVTMVLPTPHIPTPLLRRM